MVEMTTQQRRMARHALGLDPNPARRGPKLTTRNRYVTGPEKGAEWDEMVDHGLAVKVRNDMFGGIAMYVLTVEGAKAALGPGEMLCPEDFFGQ